MDKVTPEDVADGIEKLAKAFVALKNGIVGLGALSGLANLVEAFTKLAPLLSLVKTIFGTFRATIAGIAATIGSAILAVTNFITMLKEGFSWLNKILMVVGIAFAAVGAVIFGGRLRSPQSWRQLVR